jgi:glycosidase
MTIAPRYPSLYQLNTRVWLRRLSREHGKHVTLAEIDDAAIDGFARQGFDWIWLLSVWRTGPAGRAVSRSNPEWRAEFKTVLPDLGEDDICGSGFAIMGYVVSDEIGGDAALAQFRERLARRDIKLMLDFVPNHTAPDHLWVKSDPNYYVQGSEEQLAGAPQNFMRVETDRGPSILAHGRDPNYPGWPDTLQLNYANPELQQSQIDELIAIAGRCDGVRCDMAMLVQPEVFQRTWGVTAEPFWQKATAAVRRAHPGFTFMAEVYWDLEWTLQHQGFDYCYDKRLYDRLQSNDVRPIRDHLRAGPDYQDKLARFLENHDESRAASAFQWPKHRAAAAITFLSPGLRFFHQGQFEGARLRVPAHLCRGPAEPTDQDVAAFYGELLLILKNTDAFRNGDWSQIEPLPAWPGNFSSEGFVSYAWAGRDESRFVAVMNYAENRGQCYLRLPFPELQERQLLLTDLLGSEAYYRDGADLVHRGLYIDQAPWQINVFELCSISAVP